MDIREALAEALDQLLNNQEAWEGEEDSVKEEHEDLIEANAALLARLMPALS